MTLRATFSGCAAVSVCAIAMTFAVPVHACLYPSEAAERADAEAWAETLEGARVIRGRFRRVETPPGAGDDIYGYIGPSAGEGRVDIIVPAKVFGDSCSRARIPRHLDYGDFYFRPGSGQPAVLLHFRDLGWIA
ncbi:hypothetical protein [Aurantiacibacter gangjinensis]|uniref:Uncharacterized protein n=1 Tax=Aurantiacibacter gangjinensis TaxID=502682 RepID=A0A0G9MR09_9SPHN|nr:hypothetical protein [Aurantiacibacter gangjinensis]APE29069.1 hypothetical protein BMF35_a2240 [Aurantiacibacter gangjinensis]KLE33161.1 hypothetical protein AAW01_04070 [Aurantiacibacter gangjinensis]